jgi:hypothetical protein
MKSVIGGEKSETSGRPLRCPVTVSEDLQRLFRGTILIMIPSRPIPEKLIIIPDIGLIVIKVARQSWTLPP